MKPLPSFQSSTEASSCLLLPAVAGFRQARPVWPPGLRQHASGRTLTAAASMPQGAPASVSQNGADNSATEPAFVGVPRVVEAETELVFQRPSTTQYKLNVITESRWPDGVPAVMGAHLMASGAVAPISTSKGPGVGVQPHLFSYLDVLDAVSMLQYANQSSALVGLSQVVADIAQRCIKERGAFALGGSPEVLAGLAPHLGSLEKDDVQKWQVGFTDQAVPGMPSTPATATQALELLAKAGIPENQIWSAQAGLPVEQAAVEYAGQLLRLPPTVLPRTPEGFPVFDVVLLSVGQDGSVASLHPNRKETAATDAWCLPVSRADLPPSITLSMPAVNSAQHVFLVALGEGKAGVVQRALEVQSLPGALPAQLVRPAAGALTWVLDSASSEALSVGRWQQKGAFPRSTLPSGDSDP